MTNTCGERLNKNNTVDFISRHELLVMYVFLCNSIFYQKAKVLEKTKLQPQLFIHLILCSELVVNTLIIIVAE